MTKILARITKIKVASVSYLNTVPFIYGMDNSAMAGLIDLKLGNPYKCFQLFHKKQVDIALIPVGSLPLTEKTRIIFPHCIGADGNVGSVYLLSNTPLKEIKTIYCDLHSVTSNKLVEILCYEHWKIVPVIRYPETYPPVIGKKDAIVCIGDKSFKMKEKFKYAFDLGFEWKAMTGLPFVFAVWCTHKNLHPEFIQGFNEALDFGISNISESIDYCKPQIIPVADTINYLTKNIIFTIDNKLKEGMEMYLDSIMPDFKKKITYI